MKIKSLIEGFLAALLIATVFLLVVMGCFLLERKINYELSYKHMVEKTVHEMVKEEALKK